MPKHIIDSGNQTISGTLSATTLNSEDCSVKNLVIDGFTPDQLYSRALGVNSSITEYVIDPRTGWTANTAINGSTTSIANTTHNIFVTVAATQDSQAYIRTSGFAPERYTYPGDFSPGANSGINFDRPLYLGWMMYHTSGSNQPLLSSAEGYIRFGHPRSITTFGQLAHKGIGVYISNTSLFGAVHDGTTLTTGTTPLYSLAGWPYPVNLVEIISNAGTVYFYINGVLADTLSGGPTGFTGVEGTGLSVSLKNNENRGASLYIARGRFTFRYLTSPSVQNIIPEDLGYNDLPFEFVLRGNEIGQACLFTSNTSGAGATVAAHHVTGINAAITTTTSSYAGAYFYDDYHTHASASGASVRTDKEINVLLHGVMLRVEPNANWVSRVNIGVGSPTRVVPLANEDPAPNLRMWGVEFYYSTTDSVYYGRLYWNSGSATSNFGTPFLIPGNASLTDSWFNMVYSLRLRQTPSGDIEVYMNTPTVLQGGGRLSSAPLATMSASWTSTSYSGRHINIECAASSAGAPTAGTGVRTRVIYVRAETVP
jgi:hypothetical protein